MKILLAIDDSRFAEAAIQVAISQVRQNHTQVLVLHVVDWSNFMPSPFSRGGQEPMFSARQLESIIEGETTKAHELVARAAARLRSEEFEASTSVREGDPKTVILDGVLFAAAGSLAHRLARPGWLGTGRFGSGVVLCDPSGWPLLAAVASAAVADLGLRDAGVYRAGHRLSGSATRPLLEVETQQVACAEFRRRYYCGEYSGFARHSDVGAAPASGVRRASRQWLLSGGC